jgi:hypothetical protein
MGQGTENGGFPENGVAIYLSKSEMGATLRKDYSEFLLLVYAEEERSTYIVCS